MASIPYAIIGIGGYGNAHLSAALRLQEEGMLHLVAVADPYTERHSEKVEELKGRGVKHYQDWREMLESEPGLKAVSIPAPINLHVPVARECFKKKLNVVLEKPPSVLLQDVDWLIECAEKNRVLCQVGFQHITNPVGIKLKKLLLDGAIGTVQNITVMGPWKRLDSYYNRAEWAGKLRIGDDWILDGPLNNPLCHFIHQGLFYAASETTASARPLRVQAELYRAHPIEGEDIVCARACLDTGVTLHSYLTTCAPEQKPVEIRIEGDSGSALWNMRGYEIKNDAGRFSEEGREAGAYDVIKNFVDALESEIPLLSPLQETRNVVLHNNACYKSSGRVYPLPPEWVKRIHVPDGSGSTDIETEVPGLNEAMKKAASKGALFSELGVEWAKATEETACDFSEFYPFQ